MKKLKEMEQEELDAFQPQTQEQFEAKEHQLRFREWCRENEEDFRNPDAWEKYSTEEHESSSQPSHSVEKAGVFVGFCEGCDEAIANAI